MKEEQQNESIHFKDVGVHCAAVLTLNLCQPQRLVVMLGWYGESVEEHQDDDQPIKRHRLDSQPALPAAEPVPTAPAPTAGEHDDVITKSDTNVTDCACKTILHEHI